MSWDPGDGKSDFSDWMPNGSKVFVQQAMLEKSLMRLFRAYDSRMGGESDLNPLDISMVAHRSINRYLDEAQKQLEDE